MKKSFSLSQIVVVQSSQDQGNLGGPLCDGEKKHMKKLSRELIYAVVHSDVHDAAKSKEPNSKNSSGGLVLLTLPP